MQYYGTREARERQEIRCSDCGHRYLFLQKALSSYCPRCGNIEYLPIAPAAEKDFLKKFTTTLHSIEVEEILFRIQEEWRLWAELVEHFEEPAYHGAYLSLTTRKCILAVAAERYKKHRTFMTGISGASWQVKLADLQLRRISNLQISFLEFREPKNLLVKLPKFLWHYERTQRMFWFIIGMILFVIFSRVISS